LYFQQVAMTARWFVTKRSLVQVQPHRLTQVAANKGFVITVVFRVMKALIYFGWQQSARGVAVVLMPADRQNELCNELSSGL
jgi:hypothetical protein